MPEPFHPELARIEPISLPGWEEKNIQVDVLRLDLIHPEISGNKWFKLRYYLQHARETGQNRVVTYGGAWSNHIAATAAACKLEGLQSAGIIRGEEPSSLSPTLKTARENGMELFFVSRSDYRQNKIPPDLQDDNSLIIPEGGYGPKGAAGAATICELFNGTSYSNICCAVGTGTMMAGLVKGASHSYVTGINVLKNPAIDTSIRNLLVDYYPEFDIIHNYHFGGYAKQDNKLITFMNRFYERTGIPSDFVYTGKLFYAADDLIRKDYFPSGSKILLIHSGGLQGNSSLEKGKLIW